jgi:small conductance mechanosensitive channel
MNIDSIMTYLATNGVNLVIKVAAAIAIWVIGRWLISVLMGVMARAIARGGKIDVTMSRYITSITSVVLTIGLVLGILGFLGVETTSFAALIAGAGIAIGAAWGGLLTHLAAGLFLQVLRPFKVGDYVLAGGVEGTVKELGLFGTTILTPDHVTTVVGNNKIFSDTIKNYSVEAYRRVDCVAKVANTVDPRDAIARLQPAIAGIANVMSNPAPEVDLLEFTPEGPKLCVRPYCHTDHYWQVYFDTNRAIVETFGAAAYPLPMTPVQYVAKNGAIEIEHQQSGTGADVRLARPLL